MDYVVFGIGFGATILVLGLLLRDFGPKLRFRRPRDGGDVLGAEELVAKISWTRFCNALGTVLALAGAAFLLTTLVSMILVVSDDTGLWVMASAYGLLLIIIAYWTWAYFHRFGSYGILPERTESKEPAFTSSRKGSDSRDGVEPVVSDDEPDEPEAAEGVPSTSADQDDAPDDDSVDPADDHHDTEAASDEAEPEPRLQTPEERLARAESPIDHGSAEGDLDLAASGPRRPGTLASRHANDDSEPAETTDSDVEDADEDENRPDT